MKRYQVPPPEEARASMVGWFDPGQLLKTGLEVVVSTAFARNADRRILDAVIHPNVVPCDYSSHTELWIDYVADTGDGWNSTYAVAHALAQPTLRLDNITTERGQLLVFGGDEVYPTASRAEYERRLIAPYETALPRTSTPNPKVFAVAGNHDWYDSLVAFSRIFCSGGKRWFAGWQTHQTVSYFACKLPHDWWLVGTDVQLDSDIDEPQLQYFRDVAKLMSPDAQVILCTAEPHWVYEAKYDKFDPRINQENLTFLEQRIFGNRIAVFLSGDLHHYRRHTDGFGRQKITAGGGGAFLYPTHSDVAEVQVLRDGYTLRESYPSAKQSRTLSNRLLRFHTINPKFGLATALLYVVLAWAVKVDLGAYGLGDLGTVARIVVRGVLSSQLAVLWGLLLFFGFFFFTDTRSPRFKRWGGFTHAIAHLAAVLALGWFASWITVGQLHLVFGGIGQLMLSGAIIGLGGYLVGPLIMGLYLFIALNVFHRHAGEFSAIRCEDFKSWLRLRITPTGDLEIYAIGIPRVPRKWKVATPSDDAPSLLVPDDELTVELVDDVTVPAGVIANVRRARGG